MPDLRQRSSFCLATIFVLFVDVAIFNGVFHLAYYALSAIDVPVNLDTYYELSLWAWLLPPVAFYFSGMCRYYDEYVFSRSLEIIVTGVTVALVMLLAAIWGLRNRLEALQEFEQNSGAKITELVWGFPTRVLIIVLILAPLLIWLWRIIANSVEKRTIGWSATSRTALIFGKMDVGDFLRLSASRRPTYRILGAICEKEDTPEECENLGEEDELENILSLQKIDEVFIMSSSLSRSQTYNAINMCFKHGTRPRVVLGIYEALLSATKGSLKGELPLFDIQEARVSGWNLVAKRILDVIAAATGLFLTWWLILLACIFIVIDSKGWPVFSQIRVGMGGRHFKLYKLRTMVIDADAKGGPLTEDNDPRITKFGNFLRKSSIDELPQLWNVLKGDMSLVGPRAVVPFVVEQFQDWEKLSLAVRPGVTGLAQTSGRDEIGFREKSLLNLHYIRNYSLWLDLRIMLQTVAVVLSMEGTGGTRKKQT